MQHHGFDVRSYIDLKTGFPCGGNRLNCGTWMDKMGESRQAGNAGIPSTPRDGAPVEIVGLCFAVVNWLQEKYEKGEYDFPGMYRFQSSH